jgi:hypothetical protein
LSPAEAFKEIGLCYGDDGVTSHPSKVIAEVAQCLGLSIKVITHSKNQPVGLLGRLFIDPWTTTSSVQDPARTIGKIHLSMTKDTVPKEVAAVNRAQGYLVTDSLTPLVSHYCRAVRRIYQDVDPSLTNDPALRMDASYFAASFSSDNSWPQEESWELYDAVAGRLGLSVVELMSLCQKLDSATTDAEFPAPCITLPRGVVFEVVVQGEVLRPPPTQNPERKDRRTQRKERKTTMQEGKINGSRKSNDKKKINKQEQQASSSKAKSRPPSKPHNGKRHHASR